MAVEFDYAMTLLFLPPLGWGVAFVWGALWGSFFNVCIHRIPLYDSVAWPPSRCPKCGNNIAAYDNLPILSWLILRGRCRRCQNPISPRYLLIELLVALLAVALYARFIAAPDVTLPLTAAVGRYLVYFYFVGTLVVLSGIDFDHQLLPDQITYPAIPIFFAAGRIINEVSWLDASIGLVAGYVLVRIIADGYYYLTGREGLGYGDGKLLALTAGLMGWKSLPLTLLCGSLLGLAIAVPLLLLRRRASSGAGATDDQPLRHVEVPFGPFLACGALCYLFLFVGRDYETVVFRLFDRFF